MQKKALEITCYVAGAGAFGVFLRWLQVMIAFNDLGLVDRSAFNVLVPAFLIAAAVVFYRFLDKDRTRHLAVPEDFVGALGNDYRLFSVLCWVAGAVLVLGSLALLARSETDKFAGFLRLLSVLGVLSGLSAPLLLELAHREEDRSPVPCEPAAHPALRGLDRLSLPRQLHQQRPLGLRARNVHRRGGHVRLHPLCGLRFRRSQT